MSDWTKHESVSGFVGAGKLMMKIARERQKEREGKNPPQFAPTFPLAKKAKKS